MTPAVRRVLTGARFLAAVVSILAIGTLRGEAQSPESSAPGTWRGQFTTDGPSGTMTVVLAYESEAWKGTNTIEADAAPPGGEVRDLKVDGNLVSWVQTFGEFEVTFKGTIEGDLLKGSIEAYQGGAMVAGGAFELKKQP